MKNRFDAARHWLDHPDVQDSLRTHRVRMLVLVTAIALGWVIVIAVLRGYQISWTGFGAFPVQKDYSGARKLWDWMQLLLVPVLVAVVGWWLTRTQKASEEHTSRERASEEVVERFFDQIAELVTTYSHPDLPQHARETAALLIRARTIPALRRLDGTRKALVLMHLGELGLTQPESLATGRQSDEGRALLDGADLSDLAWAGGDMRKVVLNNVSLKRACVTRADLTYARITHCSFAGADLRGAVFYLGAMTNVDLSWANLAEARLSTTRMTKVRFDHARCRKLSLAGTSLRDVSFVRASLQNARLVKAVAHQPCSFEGANLARAELRSATMARCSFRLARLQHADLSSADLRHADFTGANLSGADLTDCDLTGANLSGAIFRGAKLDRAILRRATFDPSQLSPLQRTAAIL
jgi:uncharacterized protein YjbI with pentapeptide repeats